MKKFLLLIVSFTVCFTIQIKAQQSEKWILTGIRFVINSEKLLPESYPILNDAVNTLLKDTTLNIEIQCFTDNAGAQDYNKTLSQKRADVVKDFLISKGITASRLSAVGYGEDNPVADNKTPEGRILNRRIEFKILPAGENNQQTNAEVIKTEQNTAADSSKTEPKPAADTLVAKTPEEKKTDTAEQTEKQDKAREQEKKVEKETVTEKIKDVTKQEEKTVKNEEDITKRPYRAKDEPVKIEEPERDSNLRYFTENLAGAFWCWSSANIYPNKFGYSFVTIHGFTSDNTYDAPVIRGLNRGVGAGVYYIDGSFVYNAFAHFRLKARYVIDLGYTFGTTELKGFYGSIAYGFPIRVGNDKNILLDLGAMYMGSPAFFARLGLML